MRKPSSLTHFTFYSLLLILFTSCTSPTDLEAAAPQLIFLHLESTGQTQLAIQTDLHSPFSILPYTVPSNCSVYNLYPNPVQPLLAVELICGDQARVELFDARTGKTVVPVGDSDSRFLDWTPDGKKVYLRMDTLGNPKVVKVTAADGRAKTLLFPAILYDLAFLPDGRSVLYSTTRGVGFGSEVWLADQDGISTRRVFADPRNIVAYLRPSPDGSRVTFILFPDSQIPFPNGELWVMNVDGSEPRRLAAADAGHGYAPAWSPDGTEIAFVMRENAPDPQVEQSAAALLSNIYWVEVQNGVLAPITQFTDAVVETPVWATDGNSMAFNVIRDGKIQIWVYETDSMKLTPLGDGFSCCAAWLPGR